MHDTLVATTKPPGRLMGEARLAMQSTREDILDHIHRSGRATVRELAALLELTQTGVRQHLAILERDGMVTSRRERGRVGRPALIYSLAGAGEARFPKNYDQLANMLIEEVRAIAGAEALQRVLGRVSLRMAEQRMDRVEGHPVEERVSETARIMREMGCVAEWERKGDDLLLYQQTCPYPNVARRNSAVCAMEVDMVRRLTGSDARLVTSLLRGDRACTYRIRPAGPPPEGKAAAARATHETPGRVRP